MARTWIERRPGKTGIRYRVKYRLGGAGTTKHYGGSFKTMKEATARGMWITGELAALRVPDFSILSGPVPAVTFAVAAKRWQASRIDVVESTQVQHRTALNRALPIIGTASIDRLTPQDVADLVVALHTAGKARESIRKTLTAMAMVFDHAGITPNPARDRLIVKLPHEEPEEPNPPTADQLFVVYRLLQSKHRLPFLFLDWSGARVSCIDLALVGDYDESRRRVRLRAATTKTRQALWIDLHPALADEVEAMLGPREDRDLEARLFPESGADALRTSIAKACKAAGVPLFSPHDLRHRRISLLHSHGVSWARIGEQVGQRNLAVTANIYTHVLIDETELDYTALLAGAADVTRWCPPMCPPGEGKSAGLQAASSPVPPIDMTCK